MKEKFMFSNEVRKDLLFHIDTSDNYDSIANRMLDEARLAIERAGMDKARELAEKIKDILNTYNYLANVQEEIFKVIAEMESEK